MESEFNAVCAQYDFICDKDVARATVYGKEILLIKSGIGKVHGALAAAKACNGGADLVITTGLAGGIDASLTQGDIVLAEKVCLVRRTECKRADTGYAALLRNPARYFAAKHNKRT